MIDWVVPENEHVPEIVDLPLLADATSRVGIELSEAIHGFADDLDVALDRLPNKRSIRCPPGS